MNADFWANASFRGLLSALASRTLQACMPTINTFLSCCSQVLRLLSILPFALSPPDTASIARLESLEIGYGIEISIQAVHALLTSSSCLRHLTIPPVKRMSSEGTNIDPLSWSSCPLESLTLCPTENTETAELLLPVLQRLPKLKHVGVIDSLSIFIEHAQLTSHWLSHIVPFSCLKGKLNLLVRVDSPDAPASTNSASVFGIEHMDKQDVAQLLR